MADLVEAATRLVVDREWSVLDAARWAVLQSMGRGVQLDEEATRSKIRRQVKKATSTSAPATVPAAAQGLLAASGRACGEFLHCLGLQQRPSSGRTEDMDVERGLGCNVMQRCDGMHPIGGGARQGSAASILDGSVPSGSCLQPPLDPQFISVRAPPSPGMDVYATHTHAHTHKRGGKPAHSMCTLHRTCHCSLLRCFMLCSSQLCINYTTNNNYFKGNNNNYNCNNNRRYSRCRCRCRLPLHS